MTTFPDIEFTKIPDGTFKMGDINSCGFPLEKPVHDVILTSYEMSILPITQEQYQSVMGFNPAMSDIYHMKEWYGLREKFGVGYNIPVFGCGIEDMHTFCNRISELAGYNKCYDITNNKCDYSKNGYRLPTEAEWEYACRAGTNSIYYWGNSSDEETVKKYCWYDKNSNPEEWSSPHAFKVGPQPVGLKLPNAFGLYDMAGNVWEACNEWITDYSCDIVTNPIGPETGRRLVFRGGSWYDEAIFCRSANRSIPPMGLKLTEKGIGFRIVRRA